MRFLSATQCDIFFFLSTNLQAMTLDVIWVLLSRSKLSCYHFNVNLCYIQKLLTPSNSREFSRHRTVRFSADLNKLPSFKFINKNLFSVGKF